MKEIIGTYTKADIFTDNIEDYALAQIRMLCDQPSCAGSCVKVMPDVHPGKVGPIGLTMTVEQAVLPNLVGIDIGCGMTLAKIKNRKLEFQKLDSVIREQIPGGFQIRRKAHRFEQEFPFEKLRCIEHVNMDKAIMSIGTLGGGNHFIEVDEDEEKHLYVVIHSGSRALGKMVAEYYIRQGQQALKKQGIQIPYELTYLTGELLENYLHDQMLAVQYAELNRAAMLDELVKGMKLKVEEEYSCIHNYIERMPEIEQGDVASAKAGERKPYMLRKGAISAQAGEAVIIPINMKEGIILGVGKGNPAWNYSAPHGSGRLLKRSEVSSRYTLSDFKKEMKGIYSSCIQKDTLDEAPFAYRGLEEIRQKITETVEIKKIIRPVYNFKASGND